MAATELKALGRYSIARVLGRGAMGVVYEGFDPRLNRRVAIKTILKSHLDEHTAKEYSLRFVREAQAVARLNHPHIVQVHDFGEEGDVAYLVMEFIRGRELKTYFDANERFDLKEAVRIMGQLCDALDFAHQTGIVHRDVKPGNVMLDGEARVKLTDFGVARVQDVAAVRSQATAAGTLVGTPAYMSPEQIAGQVVDRRTDVFAAGIIAYQFLTGEMPFTGSGAWTIAKKIMQDEPALPSSIDTSVGHFFDAVIAKALAKDPGQRFQSTRLLGLALKHALEGKSLESDADKTVLRVSPLAPRPPAAPRELTPTPSGIQDAEVEFWRSIKDATDASEFDLYLRKFPDGVYADLARHKIAKLRPADPVLPEKPAPPPVSAAPKADIFDAEAYIAQKGSKSEAIRSLASEGKSTAEIARLLDVRYQHAYNVLAQKKAAEESPGPGPADEEAKKAVDAWDEAERHARRVAEEEAQRHAAGAKAEPKAPKPAQTPSSDKRTTPALATAFALAVALVVTGTWFYLKQRAPTSPAVADVAVEKRAAEERAAKFARDNAAAAKLATEKAEADKAAAAKLAAEKTAAERAEAEKKAAAERAELDHKAAAARLAAEKAAADKAAAEKAAATKLAAEKAATEVAARKTQASRVVASSLVAQDPRAAPSAGGSRHALLIGISQYAELEGLKYADADVKTFYQVLTQFAGYQQSNVTILLNTEATKARIMNEIAKVVRDSKRQPMDHFILMYAGHAMPARIEAGRTGQAAQSDTSIFLAPSDASTAPSSFFSTGREIGNDTFINRAWLARQLSEIDARSIVIILDSAYSGTAAFGQLFFENLGYSTRTFQYGGAQRGVSDVQPMRAGRDGSTKRIVYLASSREDQPAAEYDQLRHGVLSYALFEIVRRAREDLYEGETRDLSVDMLYSNITALFHETRINGRPLEQFHQPILMPLPSYAAVKDMPFITIRGMKKRQ